MRIGAQMTAAAGHRPPEVAAKAFTFTTAMLLLFCVVFLLFWVGH